MNQIPDIQNSEKELQRLAAQRELYTSAKKIHLFQVVSTVLIPVTLASIALYNESLIVAAAIYGVIIFLIDNIFTDQAILRRKETAAKIQELFDCEVLALPKSPLKIADDVTVETVLQHYNAHSKIKSNIEKIRNWYSPSVGQLPLHIARVICQRTNCWWDSKLRKNYAFVLKCMGVIVLIILLLLGYFSELSLTEVTLIASGLVPFFQFCIKQSNDNVEAANRLDQLIQFSLILWENGINGANSQKMTEESRKLQDEIYEHRKRSPLILNSYYNLFRDKDENVMNKTGEILSKEALSKL